MKYIYTFFFGHEACDMWQQGVQYIFQDADSESLSICSPFRISHAWLDFRQPVTDVVMQSI